MEHIRDFYNYALYKCTFTLQTLLRGHHVTIGGLQLCSLLWINVVVAGQGNTEIRTLRIFPGEGIQRQEFSFFSIHVEF